MSANGEMGEWSATRLMNLVVGDELVFTATGAMQVEYRARGTVPEPRVRDAVEHRDEQIQGLRQQLARAEGDLERALEELDYLRGERAE